MYELNIYWDKKLTNTLKATENDVLRMYFNTKEIFKRSSKVKTISYDSIGTILKMAISFENGSVYEYTLIRG